jgi:serine/threonine protein kinase
MPSANHKEQALRADQICDSFEQSWRDGEQPAIEDLLKDCTADLRDEVLRQLLLLELDLRKDNEETPTPTEYVRRFPDDVPLIEEVFREFQETVVRETSILPHQVLAGLSNPRGKTVGKYTLLELLGEGGMGVVYKARDRELNRLVALKMIRAGIDTDEEALHRFHVEAKAISKLNHPNIAQILEVGECDRGDRRGLVPFFALEFAEGGSFDARLRGEPQSPKQAARQVKSLAEAVQAAHDRGLVHRDLKPANILIAGDGRLLITDFGLVKRLESESRHTASGDLLGTPSYMAPEQTGPGGTIGPAVDIYSLGAILYEMLTGRPPFKGATVFDTLEQVRNTEPVHPRRLQPGCPPDLDTICMKCLEKSPHRRYASAADLAADLQAFLGGGPIQARPAGVVKRAWMWAKQHPAVAASILLAVLAAMAFTSFAVRWLDGE